MFIVLASSLCAGSMMVSRPLQFLLVAPPQLGHWISSERRWHCLQALDMAYAAPALAFSAFLTCFFVVGFSLRPSPPPPAPPAAASSGFLRRSSSIHSNL